MTDPPVPAPFGDILRRFRLAADLTQAELAKRAGLSARGVQNLENVGARPHRETVERLARALGLDDDARQPLLAAARPRPRRRRRSPATESDAPASPATSWHDHGRRGDPNRLPDQPNMPTPVSTFIGREQQVAEVTARLLAHRLVVLTGVGGCGKTRLAFEVAAGLQARFADGVRVVPLASLGDPGLVEPAVASALGLGERFAQPHRRALDLALRDRELLLVLDSFEHLLDAAPLATEWLEICPGLTILATSRELLRLPGEQIHLVPPLMLPTSSHQASDAEAIRLFVSRASSVCPGFRLSETTAPAVIEICRRLDGLPLAIELAAAWARTLGPEQIAARLDDPLRLLVRGSRSAPARQRSLRATFDWSYALLSDDERVLLRRLSVFAGGWTLAAAEAVAGDGDLDVLEAFSGLFDKSLVTVDERGSEMRYSLLETIRQYGAEHLAAAGETDLLRRRHATWALDLAERAWPNLWGPDQVAWVDRLDREHDNLRAALAWSAETGEVERGFALGWLLCRYWDQRGHYREARGHLSSLLAAQTTPSASRALALVAAGMLAFRQGDLEASGVLLEEGLALGRSLGHASSMAVALVFLGACHMSRQELDRARERFKESRPLLQAVGDERTGFFVRTTWLLFAGIAARLRADEQRATELLEAGLALARAHGDGSMFCSFLSVLASVALGRGDAALAATYQREGLAHAHAAGSSVAVALGLDGLACTAMAERQAPRAASLFGASAAIWERLGAAPLAWFRADNDQALAAARQQIGEGAFAAAWAEGRETPLEQVIEAALATDVTLPAAPRPLLQLAPASPIGLNQREREVAALVANGRTNRQIAERLALSQRTVEWYVARLRGKLGLGSRVQLAAWAAGQLVELVAAWGASNAPTL